MLPLLVQAQPSRSNSMLENSARFIDGTYRWTIRDVATTFSSSIPSDTPPKRRASRRDGFLNRGAERARKERVAHLEDLEADAGLPAAPPGRGAGEDVGGTPMGVRLPLHHFKQSHWRCLQALPSRSHWAGSAQNLPQDGPGDRIQRRHPLSR